ILYIIAKDRFQRGVLPGGIVGTLMSNYGLELALANIGIPFIRSNVGDRYVLEALRENDWKIGGETSGHILCLDKTTTGDGIVAALQVLATMIKQDKTLSQLTADITLLPQALINLKTTHATILAKNSQVLQAVKKLEDMMKGEGRILLRPSGTEPLLRVMVEGKDDSLVNRYAQQLCDEIQNIDSTLNGAKAPA
ncbi:MAG: phosphoglucosamine mutase, partial [bacterium]|nr:phosphoglucosamine mutase [bacterium]